MHAFGRWLISAGRACAPVMLTIGLAAAAPSPAHAQEVAAAATADAEPFAPAELVVANRPITTLRATAFVGMFGGWALQSYLEQVKPVVDRLAKQCKELGRDLAFSAQAYERGDVVAARRINRSLVPSYAFESSDDAPNPIPTKAMLRVLGLPVGHCRPPMTGEPPWLDERARAILEDLS